MAKLALLLALLNLHEPGEVNFRLRTRVQVLPRKSKRDERVRVVLFDWVQS